MSASDAELVYLYAVVEAGSPAADRLHARDIPGIVPGGLPLYAIDAEGLIAAVSRVPAARFAEAPLNALVHDLAELAPYAVAHEEAIGALLRAGPAVVPMAFGGVFRDEAGVAATLRARAAEFHDRLGCFRDRLEWGIKGHVDATTALVAAERGSDELRRLDAEAAAAGPGRAYLLQRRRTQILHAEADRLLRTEVERALSRLGAASVATVLDELPPPRPGERQLAVKAAFLVDRAASARFRALADEVERESRAAGLLLAVTGPWAPYSFVGDARVPA